MGKYRYSDLDEYEICQNRCEKEGNYQEALNCAKQALKKAEPLYSPTHSKIATCYNNIAYYQYKLLQYKEAEANYLYAIKITEEREGTDSPEVWEVLENLAILYQDLGRYKEAEELIQRALKLIIKEYGPAHLGVPKLLNNLGVVLDKQGRFQEAEMRYNSSINNWEALKGPSYHEIAIPMSNLGELYLDRGQYSEAEEYIKRALEIQQKAVPAGHHSLAGVYYALGKLYYGKNEYQRSLDYHNKALEIRRRTFGEKHPQTANSFNQIAMTLKILGHYEQAINMYLEALEIYEKIYDGDHPDISNIRNNLALIYSAIGDYERADSHLLQALESKPDLVWQNHNDLAVYYLNLANLCIYKKDDQQALEHCQKVRNILEQHVEPDSPKFAHLYNTMATIYKNQERYSDAEKYFKKGIEIYERSPTTDPVGLSIVWANLAGLYQDENNYKKAEYCLKRSIQILEDGISPDHPNLIELLLRLAILRMVGRNYPSALNIFRRVLALQESCIDMVFTFTDEEQKLAFIDFMSTAYLVILSAIHHHMAVENPEAVAFAFETVVRRKGIVLEAEARTNKALQLQMKGALKDTWRERSQKFSQLAKLVRTVPSGKENGAAIPDSKNKIESLRKEIEALERRLKKEADLELPVMAQPRLTGRDIANALPDRCVLLEFVKIRDYDFSFSKNPWGLTRYIVFILMSGGTIRLVDLGNAEAIDPCIRETLGAIRSKHEKTNELLRELFTLVLAPLGNYLEGIERLIICPDGLISLVPFAALIDNSGNYLVKRCTISYVTGSREIVPTPRKSFNSEYRLVLVADPDFDYQESSPHPQSETTGTGRRSKRWERLEGTRRESENIPPLVPAEDAWKKIITGKQATKKAVLSVVNPGILHLATHGISDIEDMDTLFSRPLTPQESMSEIINSLQNFSPPMPSRKTRSFKRIRLLNQSGLALAGANHADPGSVNADGLLTGLEVTGMDLHGTELVVLSACDTGFGESIPGEGVSGLRRAFAIAGARNLVMSLWLVEDECTRDQMETFYRNLLGMPPAEALRQAQLQSIKELEKGIWGPFPLFWAPFIIQGGQALTASIYDTPEGPGGF